MSFRRSLGVAVILGGAALAARVAPVGAQRPPDLKRLARQSLAQLDSDVRLPRPRDPVEFKLTGVKPDLWKPETALLRVSGMGDASGELTLARLIARVGVKEAMRQRLPDPWSEIVVPEGLDLSVITDEVVSSGRGGGGRGVLPKPALVAPFNAADDHQGNLVEDLIKEPGSNNWVIGGRHTTTGKPLVANDPHRE